MPCLSEMWIGGCPPLGLFQSPGLAWWGKLVNTENCFLSISLVWFLPPPSFYLFILLSNAFTQILCASFDFPLCISWSWGSSLQDGAAGPGFLGEYFSCPSIQVVFIFRYGLLDWWLIKQTYHRSHYWGNLHLRKQRSVTLYGQEKSTIWERDIFKYTYIFNIYINTVLL